MKAYWVWMISEGKRVLPLAPFDTEAEALKWMRSQPLIPNMTRGVYYGEA